MNTSPTAAPLSDDVATFLEPILKANKRRRVAKGFVTGDNAVSGVTHAQVDFLLATISAAEARIAELTRDRDKFKIAATAFDPGDTFIRNGVNSYDLEPHFMDAMGQLTERQAYSKSACAQLIAEQAHARASAESRLAELEATMRKRAMFATDSSIIDRMSFRDRVESAESRLKRVEEALRKAVSVADEARDEWDAAPSGMKAGKLIIALSGGLKGYRADIDAIHAALSPSEQVSPTTAGGT